jgi:hypothetical protein
MPGPYFKGQKPLAPCGCFFPDVTRIRDEDEERIFWCVTHKQVREHRQPGVEPIPTMKPIPSEAWREQERLTLRDYKEK